MLSTQRKLEKMSNKTYGFKEINLALDPAHSHSKDKSRRSPRRTAGDERKGCLRNLQRAGVLLHILLQEVQ